MRDLYKEVSDRIASELSQGVVPWVKPWSITAGRNVPQNAVSNRPYSGCNVVLLWLSSGKGWPSPRFLTYKQAQAAGGNVRKGEKGTAVYFVKTIVGKDKLDPEKTRAFGMMRVYTVFNVAQCDGLPESIVNGKEAIVVRNSDLRDASIDEWIAHTGAVISEGHGEACYRPGADSISMPAFEAFKTAANFYSTSFHELAHWTGHKSRLDRSLTNSFGSKDYAAEELTAELTSAFLCAEWNIDGEVRHASYIATWIQLLRDDSKAFFSACSRAQKAADFLRSKTLAEESEQEAMAA